MDFSHVMIINWSEVILNTHGVPVAKTEGKGAPVSTNRFQIAVWGSKVKFKCINRAVRLPEFKSSLCHCVSCTVFYHVQPQFLLYKAGIIILPNTFNA